MRDVRANPRLSRPARALLRRRCLACVLLHLRRLTSTQVRHLCLVHILISPSSVC
ncbi:hypothetical protein HMPREF0970_01421 [Schaalia odontolytica F0309]|uniref:Uncharacterized protein n=1 Tax=Schaalia odontolytica F0309 TaxID=649742 RepID=D4TZN5_9ACTO|nr:hypothetical protein HMPREF0970_01421 [Schaalia odontolytica F0309]